MKFFRGQARALVYIRLIGLGPLSRALAAAKEPPLTPEMGGLEGSYSIKRASPGWGEAFPLFYLYGLPDPTSRCDALHNMRR